MSARRRAGLVLLSALAALTVLRAAGSSSLATPPLASWGALEAWYARTGPALTAMVLLRMLAVAASGWLVVVAVLQLLAPVSPRAHLWLVVDAVSPRFLRAISTSVAGLSVSAGLALPVLPSGPSGNPPGTAVMVPLDVPAPPPSTTTTAEPPPSTTTSVPTRPRTPSVPSSTTASTTTTIALPEQRSAAPVVVAPAPDPAPDPAPAPARAPAPASAPAAEVVVAPGDSFWSIAEAEVGGGDVLPYWRMLIELNRDRLVDPSNPDLLYPRQVLRLP